MFFHRKQFDSQIEKKNSLGIQPDLSQTIHIQVIPC